LADLVKGRMAGDQLALGKVTLPIFLEKMTRPKSDKRRDSEGLRRPS